MTFAPKAGHESDVEQFLRGGREIVEEEDGTLAWFALKFEDGRYGIFDVFPDTQSRLAHLAGRVPRELAKHAASLLGSVPDMDKCDVLAGKLADCSSHLAGCVCAPRLLVGIPDRHQLDLLWSLRRLECHDVPWPVAC